MRSVITIRFLPRGPTPPQMVEHAGTHRSRASTRRHDPNTHPTSDTAQQPGASCRIPGDSHSARRRERSLAVTHTTRSTPTTPDNPAPQGTWTQQEKVRSIMLRTRLLFNSPILVGDTGIEPVTSSVSGKRAPAAPIARADDGTRTRDPHLGKVMLYQLSHIRVTPLWGAGRKLAEVSVGGKTQSSPCPHEVSHAPPTRLDHRAAPGDLPGDAPT